MLPGYSAVNAMWSHGQGIGKVMIFIKIGRCGPENAAR
jgi:putative component of membrane protein insertase Oxa1/YidC/SpoIIIJ protein YidD